MTQKKSEKSKVCQMYRTRAIELKSVDDILKERIQKRKQRIERLKRIKEELDNL